MDMSLIQFFIVNGVKKSCTVEARYIVKNGGRGEINVDIASDPSTW